jgi:hypothetical protein
MYQGTPQILQMGRAKPSVDLGTAFSRLLAFSPPTKQFLLLNKSSGQLNGSSKSRGADGKIKRSTPVKIAAMNQVHLQYLGN